MNAFDVTRLDDQPSRHALIQVNPWLICRPPPAGRQEISDATSGRGHWKTQTFIAGLRCHGLTAPFVIDTPMNRRIFKTYAETQLAPTLAKGDDVRDNLATHKSPAAETAIRARGAWPLFVPIEMAFLKLKAHLGAKPIRIIDALWQAIGDICNLFSPTECRNYFAVAGYGLT
ncbi:hypothetical protein X766_33605 [Mesorhizobium sp. LSJC255A00]|uniref:hypothetical protein n=1 Tax=Mesorhizobium sp. LSJC255A00 TaxID=1287313 RepID=UPI0003CE52A9|nr:hypothetical protein [Mesorhizobium sp. LSJC255A00]ESX09476.1 hypothetical protein X766_33605 [Mesorhizobium sp. LSJC255A00]